MAGRRAQCGGQAPILVPVVCTDEILKRRLQRYVRRAVSVTQRRIVVEDLEQQRRLDHDQMARWVSSLAPWQVVSHLTWRDRVGLDGVARGISSTSAAKCYEGFMRRQLPHLSYFYAVEPNPSRYGTHVHSLWADARGVYRKEAWAAWFKRFGRARIEPVRDFDDVSRYLSKYVTKRADGLDGVWWNCKLQWHRVQALNNSEFKLKDDSVGRFPAQVEGALLPPLQGDQVDAAGGSSSPERGTWSSPGEIVAWKLNDEGVFVSGL